MRFLSESRVYFSESEASGFGIEILKAGTVIFPKAGGAIATNKKRILALPGAIDLNCMGVTANGVLNEKLLYWFFESFNLSSIADGTVLPQINKKKVCALEIAFPVDENKQAKLLDEIEAEISKSDAVVQVVDYAEKKVSALRRSLLHAAFTGELTKEWRVGAHV
jgi:type I restriction enzyme S subunit